MNTVGLIQTIREYIASDSTIQSLLGVSTTAAVLERFLYQDSAVGNENGVNDTLQKYGFPGLSIKTNDEDSVPLGVPTNTVIVYIIIHNSASVSGAQITNLQIKDRLRLLLRDKNVELNNKASSLSPAVNLKVRDSQWVGGITYDDKTQGSERLHKIVCTIQMIVGD